MARRWLRRVAVTGDSMEPALEPGDRLLVVPWRGIQPGHLVVVADPREPARLLVKRVTAIEGDAVQVAGDNPAGSTDSRHFGAVARSAILGRAVYRYAPASRAGRVH